MNPSVSERQLTSADTQPWPSPSTPVSVRAFGLTDKGRVRSTNEDHFLIANLSRTLRIQQTSLPQATSFHGRSRGHVLLVADGMGGHAAGEVASALTLESVEAFVLDLLRHYSNLQASDENGVISDLRQAVTQADARIIDEGALHPELAGMGTTLTMAFISGSRLFVIHAGDSRCYLFRGGQTHRMSEDHTMVAEMVSSGEISSAQALNHPQRHVVTNVLGGGHAGVRVDVQRIGLEPGDVLLLCTDGLTEMLDDAKIAATLAAETEPASACAHLVAQANEAGGKDNITVVVARFDAG